MIITTSLGWHEAQFSNETGVLTLVSPTTGPLDLSASEAYSLLQFLFTQQELLQALSKQEEHEGK
jgi:hypothetical protein